MRAGVRICACAISIADLDLKLFIIWLTYLVKIRMKKLSVYDKTEVHLPICRGTCSNLDFMQILLIIQIAVLVHWKYFMIKFFVSGIKDLSPSMKAVVRICACAISLDRLDLRIVYVWLTQLVKHRIILLSVLFQKGSSSSYCLRKLLKFRAYTNSLDHLDCSLAVFYNNFLFQVANFFPYQ